MTGTIIDLIWVCQCCMLCHANGECCADDEHGGDSREPLSEIQPGYSVTAGLLEEEHNENCTPADRDEGCDCDRIEFSTSRCEGCGSFLAGQRYALTLWRDEVVPV